MELTADPLCAFVWPAISALWDDDKLPMSLPLACLAWREPTAGLLLACVRPTRPYTWPTVGPQRNNTWFPTRNYAPTFGLLLAWYGPG